MDEFAKYQLKVLAKEGDELAKKTLKKHKIKKGIIIGTSATAVAVGGVFAYRYYHNRDGALSPDINDSYAAW